MDLYMLSELKTEQFCAFQPFMKRALEVAANGGEVDMTQTKMVYGRIYFLKYRELVDEAKQAASEAELASQVQPEVEAAEVVVAESTPVDYDAMSDDELRALGKEAKLQGTHNMKRENLIAKLQDKA